MEGEEEERKRETRGHNQVKSKGGKYCNFFLSFFLFLGSLLLCHYGELLEPISSKGSLISVFLSLFLSFSRGERERGGRGLEMAGASRIALLMSWGQRHRQTDTPFHVELICEHPLDWGALFMSIQKNSPAPEDALVFFLRDEGGTRGEGWKSEGKNQWGLMPWEGHFGE